MREIDRILVGVDFSPESEIAVDQAVEIALAQRAALSLVHILPQAVGNGEAYLRLLKAETEETVRRLAEQVKALEDRGLDASAIHVTGHADVVLSELADKHGADLVVVGTHGRTGIKRFLLGSVAERVTRLCGGRVLVAREKPGRGAGFHRILVPTDFGLLSRRALETALLLAPAGGEIQLLHCWQPPAMAEAYWVPPTERATLVGPIHEEIIADARREGDKLLAEYRRDDRVLTFEAMQSAPASGIQERAASTKTDLILMGSHGRRGVRRFLLGSVAEMTVRHASCSVMVVHPLAEGDDQPATD